MRVATLARLQELRRAKRPVALATRIDTGDQIVVEPGQADAPPELAAHAAAVLRADHGAMVEVDGVTWFVHGFNPPLRMYVVGAVHISQALAPMAAMAGYDVTVIDPRRAFATEERLGAVTVRTDWPDEALADLGIDTRTAVVTLTHDPKIDDPALAAALPSEAFYIGSLGSRRTHARRLERLAERGFDARACARIHAPVGLDIGARSPAEIAVAVLAEITAALRRGGER